MFTISTKVRAEGEEFLKPERHRRRKIADYGESIIRLQQIMAEIPTQYRGVEDMYGRDISLVHVSEIIQLDDLFLSGSKVPKEIPHPTEEQKVPFNEVVAIIKNWTMQDEPL